MAESGKQNCVKGTIHQGSQSLSVLSRGRQCGLMALAAALQNRSVLLQTWTEEVVDEVVRYGDNLYMTSLKSGVIPDEILYLYPICRWWQSLSMGECG